MKPGLAPVRSFDEASKRVVEYLRTAVPMGAWAVTRVVDDRQVTLLTDSPAYGGTAGDEFGVIAVGADAAMAAELAGRLEAALDEAGAAGSSGYAPYGVVAGFVGAWREADTAMYASKRRRHEARELSDAGPAWRQGPAERRMFGGGYT